MAQTDRTFTSDDGVEHEVTWANIKKGIVPWTELDDDELGRGKLRDKNGQWRGGQGSLLPRDMVPEITRRLKERFDDRLRAELKNAQGVFLDIMNDDSADPKDRLKAAQYMMERLIGKVPDKVEVIAEVKPWEGLIEGILTDVPDGD